MVVSDPGRAEQVSFDPSKRRHKLATGTATPGTERPDVGDEGGGLGDRVRTAATVLREGEAGHARAGEGESDPPR